MTILDCACQTIGSAKPSETSSPSTTGIDPAQRSTTTPPPRTVINHDGNYTSTVDTMAVMVIIARHKTAMARTFISRPVQQALADGLITPEQTFFDYGCGRGGDVRYLEKFGCQSNGWDPAHFPDNPKKPASVVNLGYVINVIENLNERAQALQAAWKLAQDTLIVSARLDWETSTVESRPYNDGILTKKGTFQKFYAQEELRSWIETVLGERPIAAAPGVFYVFRSKTAAQRLLASHTRGNGRPRLGIAELICQQHADILHPLANWVHSHHKLPTATDIASGEALIEAFGSVRAAFFLLRRGQKNTEWAHIEVGSRTQSEKRFEANLEILQPIIDFLTERGRLPYPEELSNLDAITTEFGTIRSAFSLIQRVTGPERWKDPADRARDDFLVYLALATFGGRPKFTHLPEDLKHDVKDFFGTYKKTCAQADKLLFGIGDQRSIDLACRATTIGKMTPEALYIHVHAKKELPTVLRVYIGCAEALTGHIEEATILKLHREKPQVSFLVYPRFDKDPHPALSASIVSRLSKLHVSYKDFSTRANPPILHRKETFVPDGYPGKEKFTRLTRQEERANLLNSPTIGTRNGWNQMLEHTGYQLRGHRLVRA